MSYDPPREKQVIVTQLTVAATLGIDIDSTKFYFIDGTVDCTGVSIEVPAGGIHFGGYDLNLSKLICADDAYTMFTAAVGGSGNVYGANVAMEVTGTGSKVFDLIGATGSEAIEWNMVNWDNCTSMGTIDNYRQGLEIGTGRFGGSPSLELSGEWLSGYRISLSIVRALDAGMTEPLFKAGLGFEMNSRFLTDVNCDLPALAAFCDFSETNFVNPSTLQVTDAIFTRNGASDPTDTNIFPNIDETNLVSSWKNNKGLNNTFVGGSNTITTEAVSVISTVDVFVDIAGTWVPSGLTHYDSPAVGQLRHLGDTPREFKVQADFALDSAPNNTVTVRLRKFDSSAATTSTVSEHSRQVNSFTGGRDVAFVTAISNITLDENDYCFWEVANNSSTTNITVEASSFFIIEERG